MNKNILVKNGCKRIPPMHETLQRRKIKSTSQVHDSSTVDGNTSTPVEDELIELVKRMPEAEQKAKSAMHFADGYRVYGARVFKSAWDFGGPHCFLATYTPFAPQLQELVANSTINVVEHIAHIADELHKAGLVKMSNRRNKKGLKAYLDTALESYTTELYPLAALYSLPRLTGKPTMDETLQVFNAVIDDLPKDLSPCLLKGNMQAILDIMLRHTCDEVDRADVAKFIAQYDPIRTKPKAISNKLKTLLTRKAKEAIQVFDPRTITFNVALLTTLQGKAA